MRVFFLSEKTGALFVNGLYLGMVDAFERSAEIDPADRVFVEVCPAGYLPVRFVFDDTFLLSPPPCTDLYFTRTGAAVFCRGFLREDAAMRVLKQEKLGGTRFTLYVQGRVQLSVENETGFSLVDLGDEFENASVFEAGENFLLEGDGAFCILSRAGKPLVRSEGRVLGRGETVRAEIPFHDCLSHTAVCEWRGGELVGCTIRAAREPTETTLCLALFESALIGADCTPFLCDELKEKAGALKEFLGEYVSVVLTGRRDEVGIVCPRKKNVFDVRYFKVSQRDGKISNIAPLDRAPET